MSTDRVFYADLLRVISMAAVVVLHTPLVILCNFGKIPLSWWQTANIYQSAVRFAVPVFIMLSGTMILNDSKNRSIRTVWIKRIPRIGFPLLFFSVLYLAVKLPVDDFIGIPALVRSVASIFNGPVYFRLWYLYMLAGLYLMTPIIISFVQGASRSLLLYSLILWAVFGLSNPLMAQWFNYRIPHAPLEFCGYSGYFVLGYYLHHFKIELNRWKVMLILLFVVSGIACTAYGTFVLTSRDNRLNQFYYEYLTLHVAAVSTGIFVLLRNTDFHFLTRHIRLKQWVTFLSQTSFGVYLIHILVLEVLSIRFHIDSSMTHPALAIPFTALVAYCLSVAITALLQKLPFHRYIV